MTRNVEMTDIVERLRRFSRRTLWKSDAADFAKAADEIEKTRKLVQRCFDTLALTIPLIVHDPYVGDLVHETMDAICPQENWTLPPKKRMKP